jgi:hypothetical protein
VCTAYDYKIFRKQNHLAGLLHAVLIRHCRHRNQPSPPLWSSQLVAQLLLVAPAAGMNDCMPEYAAATPPLLFSADAITLPAADSLLNSALRLC